ncbi:MAG TPA: C25 family cysteine peptidase, partial [Thermoanaerobaculia bacterium]
ASRTAAFTQTFASSTLSATTVWNRDTIAGWTSDNNSLDYGIWDLDATISSYTVGGAPNGNYAVLYSSSSTAAANPPTANPQANTFRLYLPTDAGAAPVKPYLEQLLTQNGGSFTVGVAKEFTVTVRIVNPTAHAITFSASKLVTANVPAGVTYNGSAQVGQGSIVSQPAVGGTGNITWNPGTLAAGGTAILAYKVQATPVSAGQRIVMTGSGVNGTRASFVDETGNTTQTRATYQLGPLCELAATQGLLTEVLVSSFDASVRGSRTHIEWTTTSEAGTIGFNVLRLDRATGATARVNRTLLPASFGRPQGGRYRLVDDGNSDPRPSYYLEEITVRGATNRYGPFTASGKAVEAPASGGDFDAAPRGTARKVDRTANGKKARPVAVMAGVRATGIVKVTAAQLATYLNSPQAAIESAIRRGDVTVTSRGRQVAWTASGDAILFFGEASDSGYANDRVYRIEMKNGGATMATVTAAAANGTLSTYTATKESEVDAFAGLGVPVDPESDFWYWDFVISGDSYYGRRPFTIDASALASSANATLEVRVQGAIDGAHKARVSVNGAWLGELEWSSLAGKTATIALPAGVLHEGANDVTIEGLVVNGLGYDVFYVDGFTLRYDRSARPENGTLAVTTTANATVTAGPFATAPLVLDTADRLRPRVVQTALANGNVSFVAPSSSLFFAESTIEPSFLRATEAASLAARSNRADYVIVAPASLRGGAESLARLRERDGLTTLVADLDQVYDEFADGNATPHAIRDFITNATTAWSKAPKYVVLAGTGSFDYRGIQGDPGLLPPMLARTADGLFAADTRFADRNNDGLPEVAIGRIPVSTNDELEAYVRKLEASERTAGTLIVSADARDRAADFRAQSEQSAAFFDGRDATRIYVDAVGAASARNSLLGAWNAARLVTWTGHGGLDRLSADSLLTTSDVPSLTSNGAVPVVVAMTCTINRFELGYVESLGAALTRSGNGGAAAVWSSAGLSAHGNAAELQRTFARLATLTASPRVGDLVVQSLAATPGIGETAMTYLLLGDPAARVSLPSLRSTTTPTARSGE